MSFKRIFRTAIFTMAMALSCSGISNAESPFVPEEYRIKIDDVNVEKAPEIRISATFLDKKAHPVQPDERVAIEVYADGTLVKNKIKLKSFYESDLPLDIAFVIPFSERFSDDDMDTIKKSFSHILEQTRKQDRVAGFFDDGRAINVAPLGPAGDVEEVMSSTHPQAQPSFMYASLDKALEEITDPANLRKDARRAIILVTDAFDTYTFRRDDVQKTIFDMFRLAKENDVHIYVIMYKPFIDSLIPLFEGLARKTGGTYRDADSVEKINACIQDAWGEIYAQTFIEFRQSGLRVNQTVTYSLEAMKEGGIHVKSEPSKEVTIKDLRFNWKLFGIVCGIIFVLLLIALIVFLLWRKHQKTLEEMEAAKEEQRIQEEIERGERCPKCRRTMKKDWKECMFCAREAAEELNAARAEKRQKAIEEAEKKGVKLEGRICPVCNRTMMPQWKECLFCKAGIGGDGGAKAGVGPMKNQNKKDDKPKGRICPVCKREMKPHWTTCLYCESDANQRPATSKQEEPKKPQENVRLCPTCGRPMKAHWDTCLYCESDKTRS